MINNYLFHGLSVFIKSVGFAIHLFKLSHKKGNCYLIVCQDNWISIKHDAVTSDG